MEVKLWRGNSGTLSATINSGVSAADASGYTAYLMASENIDDTTLVLDISTNTWDASTAMFTYTQTDTSINAGKYVIEFYIEKPSERLTVDVGDLFVRDTLSKNK